MGLLDQVLGGMLGTPQRSSDNNNPSIVDALTSILAQNGSSSGGGLGGILGGLTGSTDQPVRSGDGRMTEGARSGGSGGLGGLLESMTRAGHGDIADSWVGTGQNRPVAPDQLETALGGDTIDKLSRQTGIPRDRLLEQLSTHLPDAVDRLTPDGRRPTPQEMNHW